MCWNGHNYQRKIAKKDITVYKVLKMCNGKYFSPYRNFIYKIGETYAQKIHIYSLRDMIAIEDGLHSYSENCFVKRYESGVIAVCSQIAPLRNTNDVYFPCISTCDTKALMKKLGTNHLGIINVAVVKCTIPFGTLYYMNDCGEVVSEVLIPEKMISVCNEELRTFEDISIL